MAAAGVAAFALRAHAEEANKHTIVGGLTLASEQRLLANAEGKRQGLEHLYGTTGNMPYGFTLLRRSPEPVRSTEAHERPQGMCINEHTHKAIHWLLLLLLPCCHGQCTFRQRHRLGAHRVLTNQSHVY